METQSQRAGPFPVFHIGSEGGQRGVLTVGYSPHSDLALAPLIDTHHSVVSPGYSCQSLQPDLRMDMEGTPSEDNIFLPTREGSFRRL
jgi:hypothetical protein